MKKLLFRRLSAGIILFLLALSLPAAGRQEDPIRQARELVANGRVNEAILLLEQTVREDPDRIVEAESLMRTIRDIRGEYNVLFELLIDNLVNNPDDITRTLEIIDSMEALDEFPNERVLRQVEDARVIAQLAYDRSILNDTMDRAKIRLDQGDFRGALELYLSLTDLQRRQFESRGYGDIFVNRVNEAIARFEAISTDFLESMQPYQEVGRTVLTRARGGTFAHDSDLFVSFISEAEGIESVLARAETLAQDLAVIRSQVPLQFPDQPVDWYLNFREMITRGRADNRDQEGLVYTIRELFEETPTQLADLAAEQTRTIMETALETAEADRFAQAVSLYRNVLSTARFWERTEVLLARLRDVTVDPPQISEERSAEEAVDLIFAKATVDGGRTLLALSDALTSLRSFELQDNLSLEELLNRKTTTAEVVARILDERETWYAQRGEYRAIPAAYRSEETEVLLAGVSEQMENEFERAVRREQQLAVRIAETRTTEIPETIAGTSDELDQVGPLLEGIEETIESDDETEESAAIRIVRYPDEARERVQRVDEILDQALLTVTGAQESLASEPEYVIAGETVGEELERLAALNEELQALVGRAAAVNDRAETLITESLEQRDEGFQRIADARAAINALQLDAARNNWNDARDAFFESLELREDAAFRTEADTLIAEVGQELIELENVIVVRRVRELLTQAENQYNQDEYIAARDTLLEAQQTWEQTNVEPNSEINRWLLLATAALNLEEGRELSVSDPLYPVLGNYLSLAREDFNRGLSLYEEGAVAQADRFFDRSIENLRNVRDVRPLNWDARIIELRIVQVRNADEFDEIFASRYNQAISRLEQAGPLEVYSELEVLAEINPDYPGIQNRIRELEIALNLRPDPIDQQRVAEAQQLYRQAQNLSTGSRDQIAVAVSLLEDAVDLNPGNNNVRFLLDQLRIRLGGQATAALSTTDEQQYRRAETLFQQGQVLQALAIAERLLSNPANQGYPPLVELRRRIGLRLGI